MKKSIILVVILTSFLGCEKQLTEDLSIQSKDDIICYGDIHLNSQQDIENFNCLEVRGKLQIGSISNDGDPIGDPIEIKEHHFKSLKRIYGELSLFNIKEIEDNSFYELLQAGGLGIAYSSLTSFNAFNNISNVNDGTLFIQDNPNLISFKGFNNLKNIDKHLFIQENPNLTFFNGFNNLMQVDVLSINGNYKLTSFEGFDGLSRIKSDLVVVHNINLKCDELCNFIGKDAKTYTIYSNSQSCYSYEDLIESCD